jgi:GNAT superfamily N-acetyltransferase
VAATGASDVRIRRANRDDAAQLAPFAARTFAEAFADGLDPADLQAHLTASYGASQQAGELADPDFVTLLALRADTLVGFAQVHRGAAPACVDAAAVVEVYRFYVDRPAHGTGVAQALMAAVHDVARELGARHLWLGTWERNARGLAFYAKAGFVDVGSKEYVVGSDRQTDRVLVAAVSAPR